MMTYGILKYYVGLNSDISRYAPLTDVLRAEGLSSDNVAGQGGKEQMTVYGNYHLLTVENMVVLVVELRQNKLSWPAYLGQIKRWEEKSGTDLQWLLGQVIVYTSFEAGWEQVLEEAENLSGLQQVMQMELKGGRLGRLNWRWPHAQAFYICHLEQENQINRRFLMEGLPDLEARLIKMQLISNLYRDRQKAVLYEKEDLDRQLSNLLHSNLVPEQAREREADELEQQVQKLSTAYGILAGDFRIISEGAGKLETVLSAVRRKILTAPALTNNAEVADCFLNLYNKRIHELKDTAGQLMVSHQNHQAAIDVVRSKIDIFMSRENIVLQKGIKSLLEANIAMQKQSLTMQLAAGLIEFIVLAYYSLSLWKYLAPGAYHKIPYGAQFVLIMSFSGIVVYCTHLIAELMQGERHVRKKLIAASILLLLVFSLMIGLSVFLH